MKKLTAEFEYKLVPALCSWSDLLGFGSLVSQNNWSPNEEQWRKIAKRLRDAQAFGIQSVGPREYMFVSNDGFIRNIDLSRELGHIQILSLWLRGIVWYHISVNSNEKANNSPGTRTVIAGGNRLLHNWDKFTQADLFYDFEGRDMGPQSTYARANAIPIMENPLPLQMNTAFSKAYILDDGGTKAGLPGNRLYIEKTAIDMINHLAQIYSEHCGKPIWEERKNGFFYAIPYPDNSAYQLGFELSQPIDFDHRGLKTIVYEARKFYIYDMDDKDDYFDLYMNHVFFFTPEDFRKSFPELKTNVKFPVQPKLGGYHVEFMETDNLEND